MTNRGEKIFSLVLLFLFSGFIFFYGRYQVGFRYEDDPLFAILMLVLVIGSAILIWRKKPKQDRQ
jgi:preprotein translocase subunit SecY